MLRRIAIGLVLALFALPATAQQTTAKPEFVFRTPAATFSGYRVQLGAGKSKAHTTREAGRLSRVHKAVLGNLKIAVVRADLGERGVYYRLRVGPLADRASAHALCRKLSAFQQSCIVIKP